MKESDAITILNRIMAAYPNQTGFWTTETKDHWRKWLVKQDLEVTYQAQTVMSERYTDKPPSYMQFLALIREEQEKITALANSAYDPSSCENCGGKRWVDGSTHDAFQPCELCLQETFGKWDGGHYGTNHWYSCKECRDSRDDKAKPNGNSVPAQPPNETVVSPLSPARFEQWANHIQDGHSPGTPETCELCLSADVDIIELETVNDS